MRIMCGDKFPQIAKYKLEQSRLHSGRQNNGWEDKQWRSRNDLQSRRVQGGPTQQAAKTRRSGFSKL